MTVPRRKKAPATKSGLAQAAPPPAEDQPEPTPEAILSLADEIGILLADLWSAGKLDDLADDEKDHAEDT